MFSDERIFISNKVKHDCAIFIANSLCLKSLLNQQQISLTIKRLANQLIEHHVNFKNTALIGIQPRGIFLSDKLVEEVKIETGDLNLNYGKLDITFYRDDLRKEMHIPNKTEINFSVEGKKVVLIDDVLYTGRTIRAALDALMDFGRPDKVELLVLIDRRYSRQLPIQPDYVGKSIDSIISQKVKVLWQPGKEEVVLMDDTDVVAS